MDLKVLFIEDEEQIRNNLLDFFHQERIHENILIADGAETFEEGMRKIEANDYDIIVLDLCKGVPNEASEKPGYDILRKIQSTVFVPVIFYSGLTKDLAPLTSDIIGVVNKGDGIESLKSEIKRIIDTKIAILKAKIYSHLKESLREYFWETVHAKKNIFEPFKNDLSLGYLLLRRIANSLSKENIKKLLNDDNIKGDKAHPMEFYIFPIDQNPADEEYQMGEILKKDDHQYVILTPSCDFVHRATGERKAERVLLAEANKFVDLPHFLKFDELKKKKERTKEEDGQFRNAKKELEKWTKNRGGGQDRFFFLPKTPFIENRVIDFQRKIMVDYADLKSFERIAKLDAPFAESMASSFIRYYNRVGYPDIDSDYVLNQL